MEVIQGLMTQREGERWKTQAKLQCFPFSICKYCLLIWHIRKKSLISTHIMSVRESNAQFVIRWKGAKLCRSIPCLFLPLWSSRLFSHLLINLNLFFNPTFGLKITIPQMIAKLLLKLLINTKYRIQYIRLTYTYSIQPTWSGILWACLVEDFYYCCSVFNVVEILIWVLLIYMSEVLLFFKNWKLLFKHW